VRRVRSGEKSERGKAKVVWKNGVDWLGGVDIMQEGFGGKAKQFGKVNGVGGWVSGAGKKLRKSVARQDTNMAWVGQGP
jgi:hypothetical protein